MGNPVSFYSAVFPPYLEQRPVQRALDFIGIVCDYAWSNGRTIGVISNPQPRLSVNNSEHPHVEVIVRVAVLAYLVFLSRMGGLVVIVASLVVKAVHRKYMNSKYITPILRSIQSGNYTLGPAPTTNINGSNSVDNQSEINPHHELTRLTNKTIKSHIEKLLESRDSGIGFISVHFKAKAEALGESLVEINIKIENQGWRREPKVILTTLFINNETQKIPNNVTKESAELYVNAIPSFLSTIPSKLVSECRCLQSASIRSGEAMSIEEGSLRTYPGFDVFRINKSSGNVFEGNAIVSDDFSYFDKESALASLLANRRVWDPL